MLQTYVHLPQIVGWLLLPRFIRKGLLITMIKQVMEAARKYASTRKCGLFTAAKIHQRKG